MALLTGFTFRMDSALYIYISLCLLKSLTSWGLTSRRPSGFHSAKTLRFLGATRKPNWGMDLM
jgi:hypothetical protein